MYHNTCTKNLILLHEKQYRAQITNFASGRPIMLIPALSSLHQKRHFVIRTLNIFASPKATFCSHSLDEPSKIQTNASGIQNYNPPNYNPPILILYYIYSCCKNKPFLQSMNVCTTLIKHGLS